MRTLTALVIFATLLLVAAQPVRAASPFADWAAVIVAGDDHAHSGAHSEVFDNARRDLATAFAKAGFTPTNISQFSVETGRPASVLGADPQSIIGQLGRAAGSAKDGCLIYFTSHGSPDGLVLGDRMLTPAGMAAIVDDACGERRAVIVVAACFSGVFVPPLAGRNRMVLTAARPDRASFGCGEEDRYTFFDTCMLQQLPLARSFAVLGPAVQTCVAKREQNLGAAPPSEPQLWIGPALGPDLPLLAFSASP